MIIDAVSQPVILYRPLVNEADYSDPLFPINFSNSANIFLLPTDRKSNPFEWAEIVTKQYQNTHPVIFIPGRRFDLLGTRHGHGGGWYDRFLSAIPRTWLRIGVSYRSQLSSSPITREVWDEPVDILFIKDASSWVVYSTARLDSEKFLHKYPWLGLVTNYASATVS